jgi:hypothetical protein
MSVKMPFVVNLPANALYLSASMFVRTLGMELRVLYENLFVRNLMLANINEESRNNQAVIDAYTMAFPTPESCAGRQPGKLRDCADKDT